MATKRKSTDNASLSNALNKLLDSMGAIPEIKPSARSMCIPTRPESRSELLSNIADILAKNPKPLSSQHPKTSKIFSQKTPSSAFQKKSNLDSVLSQPAQDQKNAFFSNRKNSPPAKHIMVKIPANLPKISQNPPTKILKTENSHQYPNGTPSKSLSMDTIGYPNRRFETPIFNIDQVSLLTALAEIQSYSLKKLKSGLFTPPNSLPPTQDPPSALTTRLQKIIDRKSEFISNLQDSLHSKDAQLSSLKNQYDLMKQNYYLAIKDHPKPLSPDLPKDLIIGPRTYISQNDQKFKNL
jgi:hypothetical protein